MTELARRAALAVDNSLLYRAVDRAETRQAAVAALGQNALAGTPIDELLTQAAQVLARVMAVPFVEVLEMMPERAQAQAGCGCRLAAGHRLVGDGRCRPRLAGWPHRRHRRAGGRRGPAQRDSLPTAEAAHRAWRCEWRDRRNRGPSPHRGACWARTPTRGGSSPRTTCCSCRPSPTCLPPPLNERRLRTGSTPSRTLSVHARLSSTRSLPACAMPSSCSTAAATSCWPTRPPRRCLAAA